MKPRHILLCLALSLWGAGLQAQISPSSDYFLQNYPQVFSPNAAEFGKYGKIPVNYFNGLPNISIPLTELKAKGYTLPVYLSYHASGNKPDQHPGWVGLGWTLHAGGCINRIVNGMKDEMSVGEYGETHSTVPPHDPGYYHHRDSVQRSDWMDGQVVTNALNEFHICDPAPDEFQVCLDDIQASFYLTENGGVKIVSKTPADFKVEIHLAEDGEQNPILIYPGPLESQGFGAAVRYDYFDRITLTNADGTRYIFGGDDDAIEYSMPLIPLFNQDGNTNEWKCLANANTWLLTRIERPDGEVVTFTYAKDGTPIIRQDVHHSEFCHYDDLLLPDYSFDTKVNPLLLENISFSLIQPSYLESIRCRHSSDSLVFSRSRTTELEYATTSEEFEERAGCYTLTMNNVTYYSYDQIKGEDYYMQLSGVSGPNRNIQLSYSSDTSRRLTLQQVSFRQGNESTDHQYTFDYDPEPLPAYHARQSDLWGFYNGINYSATHYKALEQARRQVNPAKAKAEMLTVIHYPTGGWTEFDYEGHDYSKEITQVDVSLTDLNQTVVGGGLRIKEIRDYPASGKPEPRTFSYLSPSGLSSGILAGTPTLYASGDVSRTMSMSGFSYSNGTTWTDDGFYELFSENPIRPLSTTDGNHVTYSRVKETLADGSCSIYQYTNHDNPLCCDTRPSWRISYTNSHILFNTFNSRELFRGLLLHKVDSSSNGHIIREELNEYVIDTTKFIKSISVEKECNGYIRRDSYRKIPSAFPYLKTKTISHYPDGDGMPHVETIDYTYDSSRRLIEAKRTVSGATERETYTYTGNYPTGVYSGMAAKNMVALPVEHLRYRKNTPQSTEKIVSAELSTWKKDEGFYVPAEQWTASLGSGISPMSFNAFNGTVKDSHYGSIPALSFTKYDADNNLILSEDRTGLPTTYVWTPDGCHPAAIFTGARMGYERRDSSDVVRNHQWALEPGDMEILDFDCCEPFTMTLSLTCPEGQNWYLSVHIDGTDYPLTKINSSYVESIWSDTGYGQYPSSRQAPVPAGAHRISINVGVNDYYAGQSSSPEGCTLSFNYREKQFSITPVSGQTVVFEDFEEEGNHTGEAFHSCKSHVGSWTHALDSSGGPYIVDYWYYQLGKWVYARQQASGNTVTINEGTKPIDHVRIYPVGAMPESYTWDAAGNLLSRTDSRGVTESYQYDGLGRLLGIFDNEGKKVEGYEYNYQNR